VHFFKLYNLLLFHFIVIELIDFEYYKTFIIHTYTYLSPIFKLFQK